MLRYGKHITKLLLTCICLVTLLLSACGRSTGYKGFGTNAPTPPVNGTPKAPYDQQVFRYPIIVPDIATFDPAVTTDFYSTQAISMVFVGMVGLDSNLQLKPQLAQSWNQSSDGLQWTFHLRPNLTFSDGTPLTSQDVAYSIDRALQPSTNSTVSQSYLGLINDSDKLYAGKIKTIIGDSILTPDANTVVINVSKKAAYFLYALTYPCSYVIEKRLIDKYGNDKFADHLTEGGGSGPFIVSQYIHKQKIEFVPNPYYYNFKPLLQKVVFPFFATNDMAYRAYQNGEVDSTSETASIPLDRLDEARQLKNEYTQTPTLLTRYFAMNFLAKPFDNLHIRQAFALSVNREVIQHEVYRDTVIATYHIIPQGMIGYNLNLTGPANVKDTRGNFSIAQQRFQLGMQEEGWSSISQMPPIKLTYRRIPTFDKVINAAIQMWQSVLGVNVIPDPVDLDTLLAERDKAVRNPNGLQMWFIGWSADYPDAQDWTTLQFGKGASGNYMNYGQNNSADANLEQAVQQQLEQADAEANPATRLLLYQNAEQQLINAVAWMPMFQETNIVLLKPYVRGFVYNTLGLILADDWANIYIAVH